MTNIEAEKQHLRHEIRLLFNRIRVSRIPASVVNGTHGKATRYKRLMAQAETVSDGGFPRFSLADLGDLLDDLQTVHKEICREAK